MARSTKACGKTQQVRFYVSPEGSDNWSGELAAPNRTATDGPFATPERARKAVRQLKRSAGGRVHRPVTVFLRGGTYFLAEPFMLTPQDSGVPGSPVTYAAYRKEKPVISGGRALKGWKPTKVNGRRAWVLEIPQVRQGNWFFRELWVNGRRCGRSRHPKKGYLHVADAPDAGDETKWNEGQWRIRCHRGDLKPLRTVRNAELVLMTRWVESHLPIKQIDRRRRLVSFGKRSVFRPEAGDPYYVENVREALNAPGEWYVDAEAGRLYYLPRRGESIRKCEVIAPFLEQLVLLRGRPERGRHVEHVVFRGLTFSHAESWFTEGFKGRPRDADVGGMPQAAVGLPGSVWAEGARHCAFMKCVFTHMGTYAAELSRGCKHNRVVDCEMSDLGAGGVLVGEQLIRRSESSHTHSNEIVGCHIHDGGLLFHSAVGVWIGQSYNNRLARNHIHDFYYTAISVGWTWGYRRSLANENVIERNHVHHIGVRSDGDGPILSDMGGIYTLGVQPGTVVRLNEFHDIAGVRYGGWGIYFDEGSTNILAENNIVYRTTHGGFHQHYGKENIVRNNVFAYGRDAQIQRSRSEPHVSFSFERNIVLWCEGELLAGNLENFNLIFDRNLYWCEDRRSVKVLGLSWEQWQAKGMDRSSLIESPGFVAPEKGDFRLQRTSPARRLGFRPIRGRND